MGDDERTQSSFQLSEKDDRIITRMKQTPSMENAIRRDTEKANNTLATFRRFDKNELAKILSDHGQDCRQIRMYNPETGMYCNAMLSPEGSYYDLHAASTKK